MTRRVQQRVLFLRTPVLPCSDLSAPGAPPMGQDLLFSSVAQSLEPGQQ